MSPVTRCWPGRGAAGEDISIVIAGLVSCPSDIHYFVIMTIHQNINYVMTLWNHSGISIYPCFLEKRRTVCCWEPSREVSAWVSLVNSALEPQSSRALVPFPVIRVDSFTIFQTRNYIIIPQPETGMPVTCLEKSSLVCFSYHLTHLFMKILHTGVKAFSTSK